MKTAAEPGAKANQFDKLTAGAHDCHASWGPASHGFAGRDAGGAPAVGAAHPYHSAKLTMKDIMMFLTIIPIVVMVVMLIVNTLFAIGVSNEAAKLRRAQIPLYAFDGSTWCFVVFCTGILGFLTFWLIHYSALNGHQSLRK